MSLRKQRRRNKNPKNILWQNEYYKYQLEECGDLEYDPDPYDGASYDFEIAEGWWLDSQGIDHYFHDTFIYNFFVGPLTDDAGNEI